MATTLTVSVKITGSLINEQNIKRVKKNYLDAMAKNVKIDFDVTTQTWRERAQFTIRPQGEDARLVSTDVASKMGKVYAFLNFGTRVRYATMTNPFAAKTAPKFIGSHPGIGGLLFVSKKVPRPGIKAREFDTAINDKWQRLAQGVLQRMVDAEVK